MKLRKILGRGLVIVVVLALLYVFFAPLPFDLAAWQPLPNPAPVGVYAPNTLLAGVTPLDIGDFAPEDIAIDSQGRIYGGAIDGKIIRLDASGKNPTTFADTHGRPLGLIFDHDGSLLVCDAAKGLLRVSADGSTIKTLATEADGLAFRCTNDLDVAADGTIYFTDSSFKYPIEAFLIDLIEHQPHGRFMSYDPKTGTTKVLAAGRFFPNGVAVMPDQKSVLFVETATYRVNRYWIAGPKQGQVEIFADNLPGIPDGILGNGKGQYWVTLVTPRNSTFDWLMPRPFLRKAYLRLPGFLRGGDENFASVAELNGDGQITRILEDASPQAFIKITNAVEHDGALYLGNIGQHSIGRIKLP